MDPVNVSVAPRTANAFNNGLRVARAQLQTLVRLVGAPGGSFASAEKQHKPTTRARRLHAGRDVVPLQQLTGCPKEGMPSLLGPWIAWCCSALFLELCGNIDVKTRQLNRCGRLGSLQKCTANAQSARSNLHSKHSARSGGIRYVRAFLHPTAETLALQASAKGPLRIKRAENSTNPHKARRRVLSQHLL